jgi:hypothetical protein
MLNGRIGIVAAVCAMLAVTNAASAYYSPHLGRWISRDPIAEPGAIILREQVEPTASIPRGPGELAEVDANPQRFVSNDPQDAVDPVGLWSKETHYGKSGKVDGTYEIATKIGFSDKCAEVIASWDNGVDGLATNALVAPQFHFEPGRDEAYNDRRTKGENKLKQAKVWFSLTQPCVYDGLAHIGEALHSYQDSFSHIESHYAETLRKHLTGPNAGLYTDKDATRFYKKGDSRNNMPDDPDKWPEDHKKTLDGTRSLLQKIWQMPYVQCTCKK